MLARTSNLGVGACQDLISSIGLTLSSGAGLACLSGPLGAGKSSLLDALLGSLQDSGQLVLLFKLPPKTPQELQNHLARELSLPAGDGFRQALEQQLASRPAGQQRLILLFDDADRMGMATLLPLLRLQAPEPDGSSKISLLLAGLPLLETALRDPALLAAAGRTPQHYQLDARDLSAQQTSAASATAAPTETANPALRAGLPFLGLLLAAAAAAWLLAPRWMPAPTPLAADVQPAATPAPAATQTPPTPASSEPAPAAALPAAAGSLLQLPAVTLQDVTEQNLEGLVRAWSDAWQQQNLEAYFAAYHTDFAPLYQDTRAIWREQRRRSITQAGNIAISVEEFSLAGDTVIGPRVRFWLQYNADGQSSRTLKELVIGHDLDGQLRILQEIDREPPPQAATYLAP